MPGVFFPIESFEGAFSGENASGGPYYANGQAYFFYLDCTFGASGNVFLRSAASVDGSFGSWGAVNDIQIDTNRQVFSPVISFSEYINGPTHRVYCFVQTFPIVGVVLNQFVYYFDFSDNSWHFVTSLIPADFLPADTEKIARTSYSSLYTPVGTNSQLSINFGIIFILRVDQTTGNLYLIYLQISALNACGAGGTYTPENVVYSVFNGVSWSASTILGSAPPAGSIIPVQAWVFQSQLFAILNTHGTDGIGSSAITTTNPCDSGLGSLPRNREGVFSLVSSGGVISGTAPAPYAFNRPGFSPFDDPNYTAFETNQINNQVYSFNAGIGAFSMPVEFSGKVYFSGPSQLKTLVIYTCDASTVSAFDTGIPMSLGQESSSEASSYFNFSRIFEVSGQLYAMWRDLPIMGSYGPRTYPANGTNGSGGTVNIHQAGAAPYTPPKIEDADFFYAAITASSIGTPIRAAAGNIGPDPNGGTTALNSGAQSLMPVVFPATPTLLYFVLSGLNFNTPNNVMGILPIGFPLPASPVIVTCPIGSAAINIPYVGTIVASGGTAPYTYAITSGTLPPGLILDPATGIITGTPTLAGSFSFTVQATDSAGSVATASCSIVIPTITPMGGRGFIIVKPNFFDSCLGREYLLYKLINRELLKCGVKPRCFCISERDWGGNFSEHEEVPMGPPEGAIAFNPTGQLLLPTAASGDNTIFQFRIPVGYDGVILGQYHGYIAPPTAFPVPVFVEGSGDIVWRLEAAGRCVRDCGLMEVSLGTLQNMSPIAGGIQVRSENLIQYVVSVPNTSGALTPGVGYIVAGLHGWFWPRH